MDKQQQNAFDNLKLYVYDPKLPLKLACYGSSYFIGAVLCHILPDKTEHPIAYTSRTLHKHEKMYSQLDKEGVSLIFGLKHFHQYLYGRHFGLSIDNKARSHIFDAKTAIPTLAAARLVRWSVMLCVYDYEIEFKTSKQHANADMLSHLPLTNFSTEIPKPNPINSMQRDILHITAD